jgi:type 2 lantibiotic biosynthesis protein LanM
MDAAQLRSITFRGTPLWCRDFNQDYGTTRINRKRARERISRWRDVLGNDQILKNRLRGASIPLAVIERLLGGGGRREKPAAWAVTLERVIRDYYPSCPARPKKIVSLRDRAYKMRAPLPFQEVLIGFVRYARSEVKARTGTALAVLCTRALVQMERQLLGHLTFVAGVAIGYDYYKYRFALAPASALEAIWSKQEQSSRIYRDYILHMHSIGLVELIDTYPVLARLLCQSVEQWVCTVAEFCQRFQEDFTTLARFFAWPVSNARRAVKQVRTDLSDRHRGGRTVLECEINHGEKIIYKPRGIRPEVAFNHFVCWLNDQGLSYQLRSIRALDRGTHGWVEAVAVAPCGSIEEVRQFYYRSGMLLGVLHLMAATDVHRENFIANGTQPVVVDLETILNDGVRAAGNSFPRGRTGRRAGHASVLSVGMLPFWQFNSEDDKCDMSALGSDELQDPGVQTYAWRAINTDQMVISKKSMPVTTSLANRVAYQGYYPSPIEHLTSILNGFREVYVYVQRNRPRLMREKKLLDGFDRLNLRILVRSTITYTRLHLYLLQPRFLMDGIDRSIELEWLARPLSARADQEGPRMLYDCERRAIEQLDVPHLTTDEWGGLSGSFEEDEMRVLFNQRDSGVILRRLKGMSDSDCSDQLAVIEKSLRSRFQR